MEDKRREGNTKCRLSRDRNLVIPRKMVFQFPPTVNKYEYTVSKLEPRFPVLPNNAISTVIAFIRCLLIVDALGIVGECHCQCVTKEVIFFEFIANIIYAVFNCQIQFFSIPKSRDLGFANPGIRDPGITIPTRHQPKCYGSRSNQIINESCKTCQQG